MLFEEIMEIMQLMLHPRVFNDKRCGEYGSMVGLGLVMTGLRLLPRLRRTVNEGRCVLCMYNRRRVSFNERIT